MGRFAFLFSILFTITILVGFFLSSFRSLPTNSYVALEGKFKKDDVFQVFYKLKGGQIQEINSKRMKVEGSELIQQIIFELPEIDSITEFRIDLGINSSQEEIGLNSISIYTNSGSFEFTGDEIWKVFRVNPFLERNDNILTTKIISNRYDPYIISDDMSSKMQSLFVPYQVVDYPFLYAFLFTLLFTTILVINPLHISIVNLSKYLFILLFFIILLMPIIDQLFSISPDIENQEKRELSQLPEFSVSKEYAYRFENYFNDNFGFRDHLISLGSKFKAIIFNTSNNPNETMIGKDGWLFYNKKSIFESYTHSNLLTAEQLIVLKNRLEKRKVDLKKEGIDYLLAFWPNKHSIYPEKLPLAMKMQVKDTLSLADQLIEYFTEQDVNINFIDIRSALIDKKSSYQIYKKLDTHWNLLGGYFAYYNFLEKSKPLINVAPIGLDSYSISWEESKKGDLVGILGLSNNTVFKEQIPSLRLRDKSLTYSQESTISFPARSIITRNPNAKERRKVLFFGDSYSTCLEPFLSQTFMDVIYIRSRFDVEMVKKVNPDIVIDAFVERQMIEKIGE
ncbi:hypothetical protein R9C00_18505 [Flammeovirgaceae bacterium SG7u.111]|nr:hypothetical protein [Flammeovirgaceae bacterium SG7u.132]WPO33695.1 hypothetical protein R9C00_18505 [Flammeovirgaceae bacterium SG7u.111]